MTRILLAAFILLTTSMFAGAADRFVRDAEGVAVTTTARIVKIDAKNRTFKVRGSDGQSLSIFNVPQNISHMIQGLKQRIGVGLPSGITINLPRKTKTPAKSVSGSLQLEQYIVLTDDDTLFQDGSDSLRFEDFKTGETISIHGVLEWSAVNASRIAKWF